MDYLELNLTVLARRQPDLGRILRSCPQNRLQVVSSRKGPPTAFYRRENSEPVPLHSRYDPLQEARQSLKDVDLNAADYFLFLGFGLGYLLDALMERVAPEAAHIFIVESDPKILRAAFTSRDLTAMLSLPHIHFAWPPAGNDLAEQWQRFFDPVGAGKSVFITHPPSLVLNPGLFKSAAEILKSKTLQIFTDINTLVGKSQAFLENFVANFPRAAAAPGINCFARRFVGVPAVLVAAGPSLDRNIHELRACQNRAMILAADTALKPLLAAGIEPHFVLSGDPSYQNYLHLKDTVTHETYLVAEATAHPESLAAFEGRTIVGTFENSSLPILANLLAPKGTMRAWGSVATMCLDFAMLMGCNPVIFVGQDLAFSDGRPYCTGLHWDKQWLFGVRNPGDWQRKCAEALSGYKIIMTEDLFGRPVATTDKLMAFWNWIMGEIERHPEINFINATEGGILRNNLRITSLREARHRFCRAERDLRSEIRALYADAAGQESRIDMSILAGLKNEIPRLQEILDRGFELCRSGDSSLPPQEIAVRLDRVRQSVYELTKLAPLLDCFNQMGNVSFLRQRAVLASPSNAKPAACEIQKTYLEFFQSLARASKTIAAGLSRIQ